VQLYPGPGTVWSQVPIPHGFGMHSLMSTHVPPIAMKPVGHVHVYAGLEPGVVSAHVPVPHGFGVQSLTFTHTPACSM
jgi:hypothetical protein